MCQMFKTKFPNPADLIARKKFSIEFQLKFLIHQKTNYLPI